MMTDQEKAAFLDLIGETKRMAGSENADHDETIAILAVERELNELQRAFEDVGAQCAESLALNVRLENEVGRLQGLLNKAKDAIRALQVMRNRHFPQKIDDVLTWRENDELAERMADIALREE